MTTHTKTSGSGTPPAKPASPAPAPAHPYPDEDAKNEARKAEQNEVAGRHKNDGQKDHKGAR